MKKILTFFVVCVAFIAFSHAAIIEGTCGDNLSWSLNTDDGVLEISGSGEMPNYFSPSAPWDSLSQSIAKIIIYDGVTKIGDSAFRDNYEGEHYPKLESVIIPNSVTHIGLCAFFGCVNLKSITLSPNIIHVGTNAFGNCNGLPSPLYNEHVFAYMPDSFSGEYSIAEGIESIVGGSFEDCINLTAITIPNSVKEIGDMAFTNCTGLTNITIPNSVTSIGYSAFEKCSNITNVTLGKGVTTIGSSAFSDCSSLTNIEIPSTVTSIGWQAFKSCTSLTSIIVDENNAVFDSRDNCNAIIKTSTGTLIVGCRNTIIPNGVKSIGDDAFGGCTNLISIVIPNDVTSIGWAAFSLVPNVVYLGTATGSPWGAKCVNGCVDGFLVYSDDSKTNLRACSSSAMGEIVIPNGVTSIGDNAFSGCSSLNSIEIPDGITSIGRMTFYGCYNLTSIIFPDGITSIKEQAFSGCSSLTNIEIPSSVTEIEWCAFSSCSGLKSFTNNAATPQILHEMTFYRVDLSTCTLYVPEQSIDLYQNAAVWRDFYSILPINEAPTAIENPSTKFGGSQKILRNGQILILRGDKTYTLAGQQTK